MSYREISEIRDGMRIDWDMPIEMDDGLVLRCDMFRPIKKGRYPGPAQPRSLRQVAAFRRRLQDRLEAHGGEAPGRDGRIVQQVPELGSMRSREVGSRRLCLRPRQFTRLRPLARLRRTLVAARNEGFLSTASNGRACSPGRTARWASAEFPTTPSTSGRSRACSRSILPRSASGKASPTFTVSCRTTAASTTPSRRTGTTCRSRPCSTALAQGHRSRMNGDWVSGPETLTDEQMGANRYDMGKTYFSHPLDDDYYKAMLPDWSKVKVPLLSAANWGGQPLHPRGNFEGFLPRPRPSRSGWRCTASSTGRTTTPITASACRRSSSAISSRARRTAGTNSRACSSTCVIRANNLSSATRTTGRSRDAMDQVPSRDGRAEARDVGAGGLGEGDVRRDGRRRHLPHRANGRGDRDHRSGRRQAACVVLDRAMPTCSWCCACSRPT